MTESRPSPPPGEYLTFPIGGESYAIAMLEASEVLEARATTPVPGAPSWIAGMLNLRGRAIPVIDLAVKFAGDGRTRSGSACVLVLDLVIDQEPCQAGLIADDMPRVAVLTAEQISEPPPFGTLVDVRYLRGMARFDGRLVLVLDAAGALTAEEASLLRRLEAPGPAADTARGTTRGSSTSPPHSSHDPRADDAARDPR